MCLFISLFFYPMVNLKIFRFIGDFLAVASRLALIRKIHNTDSLSGLSLKTQILYLIVYVFRYLDLVIAPFVLMKKIRQKVEISLFLYNTIFKFIYLAFQIYIIAQFYGKRKYSYSKKFDTFPIVIFLSTSGVLALYLKNETGSIFFHFFEYIKEYLYSCSLILESLSILPQLVVSQDSGECEKLVAIFITCLGLYRLNYFVYFAILWMRKLPIDPLLLVSSLVQSVLYIDFYRVYFNMFKFKWN